jgi:hypothetical protein
VGPVNRRWIKPVEPDVNGNDSYATTLACAAVL